MLGKCCTGNMIEIPWYIWTKYFSEEKKHHGALFDNWAGIGRQLFHPLTLKEKLKWINDFWDKRIHFFRIKSESKPTSIISSSFSTAALSEIEA